METHFKVYEALSKAMNNPEWDSWLNEYVIVKHEAEIRFETMPPGGIDEEAWDILQALLRTTAKERFAEAMGYLTTSAIAANQRLDAPVHLIILHPTWRHLFGARQFHLLGMPLRFSSLAPQMLLSEEKYGKWAALFPGELAENDRVINERRRKFALRKEKDKNVYPMPIKET